MPLHHKDCGGIIEPAIDNPYEWDDAEGHHGPFPRILCQRCGAEITGDRMIAEDMEEFKA